MTTSTQPPGIYRKFDVRRVDGRDAPGGDREGAEYIVLDLTYDEHARTAALAYASAIQPDYPNAAADIHDKIAALPPIPKPAPAAPPDTRPAWQRLSEAASRYMKREDEAWGLLALRDDGQPPLVLSMGGKQALRGARGGQVLAQLLAASSDRAPWYIFGIRPPAEKGLKGDADAAERIMAAARLVDLPIAAVVLCRDGVPPDLLAESDPAWFTQGPAGNPVALPAVGGGAR